MLCDLFLYLLCCLLLRSFVWFEYERREAVFIYAVIVRVIVRVRRRSCQTACRKKGVLKIDNEKDPNMYIRVNEHRDSIFGLYFS